MAGTCANGRLDRELADLAISHVPDVRRMANSQREWLLAMALEYDEQA